MFQPRLDILPAAQRRLWDELGATSKDFVLYGGSAETHEKMQDFTIRLTEKLQKKGKRIRDAAPDEIRDIAGDLGS